MFFWDTVYFMPNMYAISS